jgi:alcohol dehydrogenase (cytochrome c)
VTANFETTLEGTMVCATGAPKWASAALDPGSKRMFVRLSESCSAVRKDPTPPQMGQRFFGGSFGGRGPGGQSYIHAIDIHTGAKVWEYPLVSGGFGGTGMLATAGKLVFFGESGGTFTALDEKTGLPVWHFETGQNWRASPMSYMVGGVQYVALAGDGGIFSFALTQ